MANRPKYAKVVPTPKLDDVARAAKAITRRSDTRANTEIKIRK